MGPPVRFPTEHLETKKALIRIMPAIALYRPVMSLRFDH